MSEREAFDDFISDPENGYCLLDCVTIKMLRHAWDTATALAQSGQGVEAIGQICDDGEGAYVELYDDYSFLIGQPVYTQPQPAVPEGWKLVPIEPTDTMMRDAADNLCGQFGVEFVRPKERFAMAVYRELLRFAPATPTTPQADGRIDHQCELCGHKWSSNDLMDDCVVCTKPAGQEGIGDE